MNISTTFFRTILTNEDRSKLKQVFMSHFGYLSQAELDELSGLYDNLECLYNSALPRKAKVGVQPECYFGHIWRVMLIPTCIFKMQPSLEIIKVAGGHDLIEEVYPPPNGFDETVRLLGRECAEEVKILTLPGKNPSVLVTTDAMRHAYYDAVLDSDSLAVHVTFNADHLDCVWDIEGLSQESKMRKAWEIKNICIPLCDRIGLTHKENAELMRQKLLSALERIYEAGLFTD